MKTLLVSGREPVPHDLRNVLERGSTSLDEVTADDLVTYVSREALGVDRLVFWAGHDDSDVRTVALNYATAAGPERQQTIFFVTDDATERPAAIPHEEMFVWPRDEDKLKLVFMTGG